LDGRRHERLLCLLIKRAHGSGSSWVEMVCVVAAEQLGVDAAAVTVRTKVPALVAATDAWAESLEEAQYTVGEGPCVAAFSTGEPGAGRRSPHGRTPVARVLSPREAVSHRRSGLAKATAATTAT
jgi:hypothetical protein